MPKTRPVITPPPARAARSGSLFSDRGNICIWQRPLEGVAGARARAAANTRPRAEARNAPQTVALIEDGPSGVQAFHQKFSRRIFEVTCEMFSPRGRELRCLRRPRLRLRR